MLIVCPTCARQYDVTRMTEGDRVRCLCDAELRVTRQKPRDPRAVRCSSCGAPLGKGLLRLDPRARRVWVGNREVAPPLSVAQFTMMELLYNAHGMVVSRNELIQAVWGEEQAYDVSNQALDALVRRLRDRLAETDDDHEFVVTVRGHGLRLENPS